MKTGKYFKLYAILMMIAMCIASCGKTPVGDDGGDGNGNNNGGNVENGGDGGEGGNGGNSDIPSTELVVSLNLTGEILNSGAFETKASGNDLYYIQAYTVGDDEYDLIPYAHGLFDTAEGLKITLEKEKQYKFLATMVVDAKNRIKVQDGTYGLPFQAKLSNKFTTGEEFDGYGIRNGNADITQEGYYYMPDLDRYYGESSIYTANPDNAATVDIKMIRTAFGLKVIVENLTEGYLRINMEGAPPMKITYPDTEASGIFSFSTIDEIFDIDAGFTNQYYNHITVRITQVTSEGLETLVSNVAYDFYRNRMTTLKVIAGQAQSSGVIVTTEDTEMKPDNQDEIEFVGGGDIIPLPGN